MYSSHKGVGEIGGKSEVEGRGAAFPLLPSPFFPISSTPSPSLTSSPAPPTQAYVFTDINLPHLLPEKIKLRG